MDLFGDLPDPGTNDTTNAEKGKVENGEKKESLFDDLPQTTSGGSEEQSKSDGNFPVTKKRKSLDQLAGTPAPKKLADGLHTLKGYYAERQGERDDMQDAHTIIDDLTTQINNIDESIKRLAFYGVFDGHGGSKASKYAASQIHNNLIQRFPKGNVEQVEKEMKKCLVESYKRTDEDFLRQARSVKPSWKDGSTAVTVLAVNDTLFIANLGDSKAVLCRYNDNIKKCTAIPLSKDHSPTQYEERIRIQKAGGQVREGRVMGQLEVSRSIGDGPYKNHGVSCVPDVKRCQLMDNDRYVLIACDGLWKRFDNESAIEYINKILADSTHEETDFKTLEDVKYESACTQLANEAVRRLSADNVTAVLVAIGTNKPS